LEQPAVSFSKPFDLQNELLDVKARLAGRMTWLGSLKRHEDLANAKEIIALLEADGGPAEMDRLQQELNRFMMQ
jgi:hypothetical protein